MDPYSFELQKRIRVSDPEGTGRFELDISGSPQILMKRCFHYTGEGTNFPALVAREPALVAQCTGTGGAVLPALVAQCVKGLLPR